ncbi:MAG: hypothetical protein J6O01_04165, partial [Bacteroidales bacterium]|nr:hypothetical protein [Bacteroidales bacterium]
AQGLLPGRLSLCRHSVGIIHPIPLVSFSGRDWLREMQQVDGPRKSLSINCFHFTPNVPNDKK